MTSSDASSLAARETGTINVITPREAKKAAYGALVGNVLEWYDYYLFNTAAALVFNVQYFVNGDPAVAAIQSFATLAVGFLMRPLGGILFGWLGDRIGRKAVLIITVTGIGIATGLIGLLPAYEAIGLTAPLLLILLRIAQGLFIGGEWSGAMTLAVENAPLNMRARMAAIPQLGSPLATLLSSGGFFLLTLFLSKDNFDSWGWRIPFLLAFPLLLIALWLRSQMHESPVFRDLQESGDREKAPLIAVFRLAWKQLLVGILVTLLGTAGFYVVTTFVTYYTTQILGMDPTQVLMAMLIGAVFQLLSVLHAGHLGQKYGASRVIIWSGVAATIMAFPCLMLIQTAQIGFVILGVVIGVSLLTYSFAAVGPVLTGLFPTTVRLSGVALAYNGAAILSGLTPMVATAAVAATGNHWWPAAVILMFFAVVSLIGGLLAPKLSQQYEDYKH